MTTSSASSPDANRPASSCDTCRHYATCELRRAAPYAAVDLERGQPVYLPLALLPLPCGGALWAPREEPPPWRPRRGDGRVTELPP